MKVSELVEKTCGKKIEVIQTGTECDFIGNLAYFYKKLLGEDVELDVAINPLIGADYINRMLDLGVVAADRVKQGYKYSLFRRNPEVVTSFVIKQSPTDWYFDIHFSTFDNTTVTESNGNGYIPLIAYFLINKLLDNSKGKLHLQTRGKAGDSISYMQVVILMCYGNKLGKDLVEIENCELGQAEWTAYTVMQQQYNRMLRSATNHEKYEWLIEQGVQSGDILLLYTIGSAEGNRRELQSCKIAIVRALSDCKIDLDVIGSSELVLTQIERVSQTDFKDRTYEDYTRFYRNETTYNLGSVGVEYLTFEEDVMLMLPMHDDSSVQVMIVPTDSGSWELGHVELDTIETIYAVLENRRINYNKERFLSKYFPDTVPFDERYKQHQPTKYENITKDELLVKYGERVSGNNA